MNPSHKDSTAPELSSDVWAQTIDILHEQMLASFNRHALDARQRWKHTGQLVRNVQSFFALQLVSKDQLLSQQLSQQKRLYLTQSLSLQVCRNLAHLFVSHPKWSHTVWVPQALGNVQLASLKSWAQRHRNVVQQMYLGLEDAAAVTVLDKLRSLGSQLKVLSLPHAEEATIQMLTAFTALRTCSIQALNGHSYICVLDLTPLGVLSHLQSLSLRGDGEVNNLAVIKHLTKLVVLDCLAEGSSDTQESVNCDFTSSLRTLIVQQGSVAIHREGIRGMQQLQCLHLLDGCIHGNTQDRFLAYCDATSIPGAACLKLLVHLVELRLHLSCSTRMYSGDNLMQCPQHFIFDLGWLANLRNLQRLHLKTGYTCRIPAATSNLKRLTCFKLSLSSISPINVHLKVNWEGFQDLQMVQIGSGNCSFHSDERVLSLALVKSLRNLRLAMTRANQTSTYCARLSKVFAEQAPQVQISFQPSDALEDLQDMYMR